MIDKLDARQQRQLAIAILALFVLAFLAVTAGPVWYANATRQAALDDAQARLERYEEIAARDRELLPQYEALRRAQKSAGNQLRSDTVAVAGAELQRRVKDITARHQAQIASTQILAPADEQGFVRVALRVRLRAELQSLLRSLYDIETNDVHMFIDNLSLRNDAAGLRQRQTQARPMEAEFDLIAYMPTES
jgi:general secretion pathway protein M